MKGNLENCKSSKYNLEQLFSRGSNLKSSGQKVSETEETRAYYPKKVKFLLLDLSNIKGEKLLRKDIMPNVKD